MIAGVLTNGAFGYLFDYIIWWVLLISLFVHTWCFFRRERRWRHGDEQPSAGASASPLTKGGPQGGPFERATRPRSGALRLVVGNFLIFACLLGVVAMAAESYLRFLAVYTDSFGVSLPARRWFALHTQLNSLGCRDKEWPRGEPAAVRRIAFVGDSFTYGWGVERVEDRFTDRIHAMLDRAAPGKVEVMNVAKPGWGTSDQVAPIRDMIEHYGVDEVVLCYVLNDIEKLIPTTKDFNPTRPPEYFFFNLDSSPLLDYVYRRAYLPFVPTVRGYHDWLAGGYANAGVWHEQQRRLEEIIQACRDREVSLRVVLLPFLRTGGTNFDQPALLKRVREFFESQGVATLDLSPAISGSDASELVVNSCDPHPNAKAQGLMADAIWKAFFASARN